MAYLISEFTLTRTIQYIYSNSNLHHLVTGFCFCFLFSLTLQWSSYVNALREAENGGCGGGRGLPPNAQPPLPCRLFLLVLLPSAS